MNQKWISSYLLPLIGLVVVLGIAYGCNRWNQALIFEQAKYLSISSIYNLFWSFPLMTLACLGAVLFLFWLIMTRVDRSKVIGVIYMIVGLFLVTIHLLYYQTFTNGWVLPFFMSSSYNYQSSFLYFTGGGIVVIGLFMLILPKKKNDQDRLS